MAVEVREETQILDEQLSADLNVLPQYLQRYFLSNIVQRVVAYLLGWNYLTGEPQKVRVTSDGAIRVAFTAVGLEHNESYTGQASDTYSAPIIFTHTASRVDIWVKDADMMLQRSIDGETWDGEIILGADTFYSFECRTKAIRVKNAMPGITAGYQIVAWY